MGNSMTGRPMNLAAAAAVALLGVGCAIVLSAFFSVEREARIALQNIYGQSLKAVVFGRVSARGVVCGKYRLSSRGGDSPWQPFLYVSHYSALSPPDSKLIIGAGGTCSP